MPLVGVSGEGKEGALDQVDRARQARDAAKLNLETTQRELEESILAAAAMGASLREIADRAGVSFQRISRIVRRNGGNPDS